MRTLPAHVLILSAMLASCSNEPELAVTVPAGAPAQVKSVVDDAWPKLKASCPGLQKYAADIQFVGVEHNLDYAPDASKRIELVFRVAETPVKIPGTFRVAGHVCYFAVTPNGKTLSISKAPCASLCTDTPGVPAGGFVKDL